MDLDAGTEVSMARKKLVEVAAEGVGGGCVLWQRVLAGEKVRRASVGVAEIDWTGAGLTRLLYVRVVSAAQEHGGSDQ